MLADTMTHFAHSVPQDRRTSFVFASPHSGRDYPRAFLENTILDAQTIRSSEDAYVDELFATAPNHGAPLLAARLPRAFLDLNRAESELDPALIENVKRGAINPRIASGLGVIPRVVANGKAIYKGKLSLEEAEARIATYWRPYHDLLTQELNLAHHLFGEAVLLDCHSMPHEALEYVAGRSQRPEVVIGDRFGASASNRIVEQVEAKFRNAGLHVVRNSPFAGAYNCQKYGRPSRGFHAIQIEIDRSLYMNEATIEKRADFDAFKALMETIVAELCVLGAPDHLAFAAE